MDFILNVFLSGLCKHSHTKPDNQGLMCVQGLILVRSGVGAGLWDDISNQPMWEESF